MNIPDNAIEAAAKADFENAYGSAAWPLLSESAKDAYREGAHKQLEAAAPFIAAQALRDAEDAAYNTDDGSFVDVYRAEIAEWLTARAADLEAGK